MRYLSDCDSQYPDPGLYRLYCNLYLIHTTSVQLRSSGAWRNGWAI